MENTPWGVVLAAFVTGTFSFGGAWFASRFSKDQDRKHDARQLAMTFKGELSGLSHVLGFRDYQTGLRALAKRIRESNEVIVTSISARQEYFAIYKANASRIGCLAEPLPQELSIFYTQAASLLEDFQSLTEIRHGPKPLSLLGTPTQAANFFERLAVHIDEQVAMAKKTVALIDQLYPTLARKGPSIGTNTSVSAPSNN